MKNGNEMKTGEQKLLSCPFCGGEAEIKQMGQKKLKVRCKSCLVGLVQATIRYDLEWLKEKLIEGWNKRTSCNETKEHADLKEWSEFMAWVAQAAYSPLEAGVDIPHGTYRFNDHIYTIGELFKEWKGQHRD